MPEDHPMQERLGSLAGAKQASKPMKTIALLAREPGLLVLQELLSNPLINLDTVVTHKSLPKAEGGGERPELPMFEAMCRGNCQFMAVDFITAKMPSLFCTFNYIDLLFCLSWRYIIEPHALRYCKNAINIHRGELPKYAGAEPVRKALESKESRVAITAHHMVEKVDDGPEIARVWHDVGDETDPEKVKKNIYPLYPVLARTAIQAITTKGPYFERDLITGRINHPPRVEIPASFDRDKSWDGVLCVD